MIKNKWIKKILFLFALIVIGVCFLITNTLAQQIELRNIEESNFKGAKFSHNVDFELTNFLNEANFDSAKFSHKANFRGAHFLQKANFGDAEFEEADFLGAYFTQKADFSEATVSDAYFGYAEFLNEVDFSFSNFGFVDFAGVKFLQKANFGNVNFPNITKFQYSTFSNETDFKGAIFKNKAMFVNVVLTGSAHFLFENTLLPDTVYFDHSNLKTNCDLTDANFEDTTRFSSKTNTYFKPHYISLYKTDISKFHLDYIHFRLVTDSIYVFDGMIKTAIPIDEAEGMYESLLNNFKIRGQEESYKLLDIEYQKFKWKHSKVPFFVIIPSWWWNFGYDKEYVFGWTGIFLLIFTLITFFILKYLNTVYTFSKIGGITSLSTKKFTLKDTINRFWFSFVYTSTIFFRLTLKVEEINYNKFWGTLYIIIMYTVGLVCLAYMANFVLQK